jgi:bifunctional non-homologous end joining protein LigD
MGARSKAWLKTKCIRRQEFVIVGWTPSEKVRGFRSLLLGANEDVILRYAGKVGTGFNERADRDAVGSARPAGSIAWPCVSAWLRWRILCRGL